MYYKVLKMGILYVGFMFITDDKKDKEWRLTQNNFCIPLDKIYQSEIFGINQN